MMANGSPQINTIMSTNVNNSPNNTQNVVNNNSTSVQQNVTQGGDGGSQNVSPGTRNPDSMYSGRSSDYSAGLSAM